MDSWLEKCLVGVLVLAASAILVLMIALAAAGVFALSCLSVGQAHAGEYGRAAGAIANTPEQRAWYNSLKRPDYPTASCCGEGEAYWADESHWEGGQMYAVITDDRPDCLPAPGEWNDQVCRNHEDIGTRYAVPPAKILGGESHGNPTGHVIIFLSGPTWNTEHGMSRAVICYVMNGGI